MPFDLRREIFSPVASLQEQQHRKEHERLQRRLKALTETAAEVESLRKDNRQQQQQNAALQKKLAGAESMASKQRIELDKARSALAESAEQLKVVSCTVGEKEPHLDHLIVCFPGYNEDGYASSGAEESS